jgi:hypothetical protein
MNRSHPGGCSGRILPALFNMNKPKEKTLQFLARL